ncbi:MAG: hypothetical protein AMXMBFR84_26400 [Candidatus Hydrogenedentota bacterium]
MSMYDDRRYRLTRAEIGRHNPEEEAADALHSGFAQQQFMEAAVGLLAVAESCIEASELSDDGGPIYEGVIPDSLDQLIRNAVEHVDSHDALWRRTCQRPWVRKYVTPLRRPVAVEG